MRFLWRGSSGEFDQGGVPMFAKAALALTGLSSAPFRPTAIAGERAKAWATQVPAGRAQALWLRLRILAMGGWVPVIVGGRKDEARLAEMVEFCEESPAQIRKTAGRLDTTELFRQWRAGNEPIGEDDEWDVVGNWPDEKPLLNALTLPYTTSGRTRPTVVAIVRAGTPYEIPAALGWGNWNACPRPEEHVAVLRHWSQTHGALLVGISGDVIEMFVKRPPKTRDAAMALAWEQYAYASDIVTQGVGTISVLAAGLLEAPVWSFWWD